jgi:hypothetical protein
MAAVADEWLPRVTAMDYDPRVLPASRKTCVHRSAWA